MKKVEIYEYYSFGFNYNILLHSSKSKTALEFYNDIKNYTQFIDELQLKVTKSSLLLQDLESDLEKLEKLAKGRKKNTTIDPETHKTISEKLKNTDKTLDAELNVISAYYLPDDKRVSQDILENNISKLFANKVFDELPEVATYDFSEAGKCLLFNRFTACAFHTLRGTEDTLKFYYQTLLGKNATESQTWWNFAHEIETEINLGSISPKPKEDLLINLNSLRKFYRNKTQHPQMIYNSDEVQDLLFLCIKTVNEMILDLETRKLIIPFPF